MVSIAALALTRLTALASLALILTTTGPLTLRLIANALLTLIALALTLALIRASCLTLALISLVVCHGHLLQWRPGHARSL